MVFDGGKVESVEIRVVFDGLHVFETEAVVWIHRCQAVDEILDGVVNVWPLWVGEVPIQNLLHDLLRVFSTEHFHSTRHFKNDGSQGPQVSVQARLAFCDHFRCLIKRSSDKGSLFLFLLVILLLFL